MYDGFIQNNDSDLFNVTSHLNLMDLMDFLELLNLRDLPYDMFHNWELSKIKGLQLIIKYKTY